MTIIFSGSTNRNTKFVVNRSHIVSFGTDKLDTSILELSIGEDHHVFENYEA